MSSEEMSRSPAPACVRFRPIALPRSEPSFVTGRLCRPEAFHQSTPPHRDDVVTRGTRPSLDNISFMTPDDCSDVESGGRAPTIPAPVAASTRKAITAVLSHVRSQGLRKPHPQLSQKPSGLSSSSLYWAKRDRYQQQARDVCDGEAVLYNATCTHDHTAPCNSLECDRNFPSTLVEDLEHEKVHRTTSSLARESLPNLVRRVSFLRDRLATEDDFRDRERSGRLKSFDFRSMRGFRTSQQFSREDRPEQAPRPGHRRPMKVFRSIMLRGRRRP